MSPLTYAMVFPCGSKYLLQDIDIYSTSAVHRIYSFEMCVNDVESVQHVDFSLKINQKGK